ncbi:hypothetical protein llap_5336 [Limosa lapponica baueri]|uniref:Uncharacterized protein n=1 Tax=Limosa lapponica baueri TaxID=1758121 RepID=A0A2I0UEG3_LIMLA|nr:hypothetical protein llap_5336 [Limosa lapponica baueri]
MSWNDCNLLQVWQAGLTQVSGYSLPAELREDKLCELRVSPKKAVGFLGCKRALPAHTELLIHQHPQVLWLRAALNAFSAQPVFVFRIAATQVQDLVLSLVELHEVSMGPSLKPVKFPLGGIPSFQHVDRSTQLGVVRKLAEGAHNPTAHVANKDVRQYQSQYRPLRSTTRHWFPFGHRTIDCNYLNVAIKPVSYPPSGSSIKSVSLQFRDQDVMQDSVNTLYKSR